MNEKEMLRRMCNKNKLKVYDGIKKKPKSIRELSKNIKMDYHNLTLHLKQLQKAEIITLIKEKTGSRIKIRPVLRNKTVKTKQTYKGKLK